MNYLKKYNYIMMKSLDILEMLDNRSLSVCRWCGGYTKRKQYKNFREGLRDGRYYRFSYNYCPKCLR